LTSSGELEAADRYCRDLANRHYENFSVASLILPGASRRHLARIYAFCRTTDDLGDESKTTALARLQVWQDDTTRCFDSSCEPVHPVLVALARAVRDRRLPQKPFLDLIDANVQDQAVSSYETWDELIEYCKRSAAPVGRMVLGVFDIRDPRADALSDDVCIGLQLANFAQDVSVDRRKGRTYLVQSDIRDLGTRGAIAAMCNRADELLASGRELEAMVCGRLRIQLALYRLGGGAIVSAVRRMEYASDMKRPHLSRSAKAGVFARALHRAVVSGRRGGRRTPDEAHVGAASVRPTSHKSHAGAASVRPTGRK
jgi:squalene synthase HpnC